QAVIHDFGYFSHFPRSFDQSPLRSIISSHSSSVSASVGRVPRRDLPTTRERSGGGILRQTGAQIQVQVANVGFQGFRGLGVAHPLGSQPGEDPLPEGRGEPV